jgi:hypothetical protein
MNKNKPVLGLEIAVWVRPTGELVMNSVIVFPVQPTCAMTVSLVRLPNENMKNVLAFFSRNIYSH